MVAKTPGVFGGEKTPMFVSWDDDIPNIWKVIKFMFQTTNQYMYHLVMTNIANWKDPPCDS